MPPVSRIKSTSLLTLSGNSGCANTGSGCATSFCGSLSSVISLMTGSIASAVSSLLIGSCTSSSFSLGIITFVTLLGTSISGSLFLAANC